MVRFVPVVEHPGVDDPPNWPVLTTLAPAFIVLGADTEARATGSVVWHLARYNLLKLTPENEIEYADLRIDPPSILTGLIKADHLAIPGGIAVMDTVTGREITPGCCAGLEEWQQWLEFERTGESPWMGHEPDPWLERTDDHVRVWSHGNLAEGDYGEPFAFDMTLDELRAGLESVSRDLVAFSKVLRRWAQEYAPFVADQLVDRFLLEFGPPQDIARVSQN